MADDKKPSGPKKDDKKSAPAPGAGAPTAFLALIAFVVFALYVLTGRSFFGDDEAAPTIADVTSKFTAPAHLTAGDTVANVEDVVVRRNLEDAAPLGTQPAGARGTLADGPETAFGREWWFVNYPDAPDGWVEASKVTDRTTVAAIENAPSAAVSFLRPIAVFLCFALAALLVWLWWRKQELDRIAEKKAEEARRSYFSRKGLPVPGELARPAAPEPEAAAAPGAGAPPNLPGVPGNLPTGALPEGWLDRRAPTVETRPKEPDRWTHVKSLLSSTSQSDWRQAVIEADIILEEMLRAIGYDGVSIGDMLKNADPADFATLDKAWDAHKVRNQIAHRGSDFSLTRQDAQNVVGKFEDVFREFNYI